MSELNFFESSGPAISIEIKEKAVADRKKMNTVAGKYASNDAFKSILGEDTFDFELNKKKLVDDLNWLTSLSVEEFTFRKKYEEIVLTNDAVKLYAEQAKPLIWKPTDINDEELTIKEINALQPKMVVASANDLERLWTTLIIYCSSAEYNQAPGRFIKFLLMDDITGKVLGVASIASDVIAISDRDKFIGWTSENKLKDRMLRYSAIGTTIVPTQPFGSNFLGGKLTAAMVVSDAVRDAWENQESGESQRCKLVGMTTTSLYGSFSMYNSLKWWKAVGSSKGKIPVKPYEGIYKEWHDWLKQHRGKEYDKAMTQKEGVSGPVTGAKMRVLSLIFNSVAIKQSDYCHGFERGVYYSCFYENTKDFLTKKITEDKLVMKPLFKEDTKAVLDWWKPKAIDRYKKLKTEGRLNPNKLFYSDMTNMSYEEAKKKYFDDVGR